MRKIFLWVQLLLFPFTSSLRAEVVEKEYPVLVLGSGVGALTSAIYLARAGIPPVVLTGPSLGGTILQSHNVQNWPGEISISGYDLYEKVKKQAESNGAILLSESVVSVDFSKRPFTITTKSSVGATEVIKTYKTHSIIIAVGAKANLLNVPGEIGEEGYWSRGVYTCAVCDGPLYKDKVLAVVGGGDSALLEAEFLSNVAAKVHILVRGDGFRAIDKERVKTIFSRPNIEVHFETFVKKIKGDGAKVTGLLLHNSSIDSNWELPIDAVFLAIGARPNTEIFRDQLELDPQGYILLKKHQQTSVEGIYAIGDVADPEFKQAVSAAGDAAKAAIQAQKYLAVHNLALQKGSPATAQSAESNVKKVIEISNKEDLTKEMQGSIVLIDFYADYCGPCRQFSPLYETWAKEYGDKVKFLKVNTALCRDFIQEYHISAIPTVVIVDAKGNVVRKMTGMKEIFEIGFILEKINKKVVVSTQDLIDSCHQLANK